MEETAKVVGMVAGAAMPLFNIPLIVKIVRRKSCEDLSLTWVVGVWGCIALMFPASITSEDIVLKAFGISNLLLFSAVLGVVVYYKRHGCAPK